MTCTGKFLMFVSSLAVIAIGACSKPVPPSPEYSFGFYNDTSAEISEVRADWWANGGARHNSGGVMSAGAESASHEQPRPIPETAVVIWKTGDGSGHCTQVDVAKLIRDPRNFSGTVYFKLTADGSVTVVPLTYADERKAAEHGTSALRQH